MVYRKDGRPIPTIDRRTFHRYQRRFWAELTPSYLTKRILISQRDRNGKLNHVAWVPMAKRQ